jgi:thiosulfate/3-mercaptopyruvate sulfurtransferase
MAKRSAVLLRHDLLDTSSLLVVFVLQDIRGEVKKEQAPGADFVATVYEGLHSDYLDAHIPGAVFVDWTKVGIVLM